MAGSIGQPVSRRAMFGVTGAGLTAALGGASLLAQAGEASAAPPPRMVPHGGVIPQIGGSYSQRAYPVPSSLAPVVGAADIVRHPADMPGPIGRREPRTLRVELETIELEGHLDQNTKTTFGYWTFNGKVPGPMLRVRVSDTVEVSLKNHEQSAMFHNVDLHAVTGPGGGAEATMAEPGETKSFRFQAMHPGLYVYHCAVPPVVMHMANGMHGLILVEPEEGLPPVDREFYVMQGEIYTEQAFATAGLLDPSFEKMLNERPEYFVFNGSVGALTTQHPMTARVGETVRFFFSVGGPNHTSSLHLIGEIFDRVYPFGALPAAPIQNVGTLTVPAGGAAIAEVTLAVPGRYVLVDHALARVERGLAGWLDVEGPEDKAIFAVASAGRPKAD